MGANSFISRIFSLLLIANLGIPQGALVYHPSPISIVNDQQESPPFDAPVISDARPLEIPENSPSAITATTIFSDNFGGSYPGAWSIGHDGGGGVYAWAWPYGYAHEFSDPAGAQYYYPDDLHVYMERRNVSLVGYSSATLTFNRIVDTEANYDFFTINVRDQSGQWYELFRDSGQAATMDWEYTEVNLNQFAGQSGLYVQFRFDSDGSVSGEPYDGVFIDGVVLSANTANTAPIIDLTAPSSDVAVAQGSSIIISWTDSDPDNNAAVSIARDVDNNPTNGGHTWLAVGLSEDSDGSGDQYSWNTSGVATGTYYIWGMIYDSVNTEVYDLALGRVIITPPGDSYEPDNSAGEAKTITSGSPQSHSIVPATDVDWVKFTLTSLSQVVLQTSGTSGDTRMWLYNSSLAELEYNDDYSTLFSYIDRLCGVDALPAGTYYVKVDEYGNDNEIPAYTLSYSTSACPSAPGAFNKSAPANGATGQLATVQLSWTSSSGATGYEYCVDTTNDNACTSWTSNGTSTTKTLSGLSAGVTYYWQVRANNSGGTTYANGSATAYWSFTIDACQVVPAIPDNVQSSDGTYTDRIRTTWNSSACATSYKIYRSTGGVPSGPYDDYLGETSNLYYDYFVSSTSIEWFGVYACNTFSCSYGAMYDMGGGYAGGIPGAFSKSTPSSGETGVSTSPILTWEASSGGPSYEYCIDTTNDNACTTWNNVEGATGIQVPGLTPGTTYYWHVRAVNSYGMTYSNGSSTAFWSFTTAVSPPGAFNKSGPSNGASGLSTSPTLSWGTSTWATSYEYCIDTTNDNACSTWTSNGTGTSKALSGLAYGTTYYWHVRAINSAGTTYSNGSASAFWSFTTAVSPPAAFNKLSPSNGTTGVSTSPTLNWGSSTGAASYEYCIDTSNDNACSGWTNNGTATSKALSGLSAGTTYYWHVRANNSGGTTYSNGSATAFWSFTTAYTPPGAFNKLNPSIGSTGVSTSPTLSWGTSSGATSYEYCIDTSNDNACSGWTSNGTSTSKILSGLSTGTTYYWHVRSINPGGTTYSNGSAAAFWSFTTEVVVSPPGAFNKTSPSNGTTGVSTSPTLSWGSSSGAASYEYCIDTTNDNACSSWINNGTSTSKVLSSLSSGTTYYWHVRAKNSAGTTYSNSSATAFWSFSTAAAASPPGAFNKSAPSNGATGVSTNPTLTWGTSSGATSYQYCYDISNDSACSTWVNNGLANSKTLSGLASGTTYYWHVRAVNSSGTTYSNGSATAFWSFRTSSTNSEVFLPVVMNQSMSFTPVNVAELVSGIDGTVQVPLTGGGTATFRLIDLLDQPVSLIPVTTIESEAGVTLVHLGQDRGFFPFVYSVPASTYRSMSQSFADPVQFNIQLMPMDQYLNDYDQRYVMQTNVIYSHLKSLPYHFDYEEWTQEIKSKEEICTLVDITDKASTVFTIVVIIIAASDSPVPGPMDVVAAVVVAAANSACQAWLASDPIYGALALENERLNTQILLPEEGLPSYNLTGAVMGQVVDKDSGVGLEGAAVKLDDTGYSFSTFPNGWYRIAGIEPDVSHKLTVSRTGYLGTTVNGIVVGKKEGKLLPPIPLDLGSYGVWQIQNDTGGSLTIQLTGYTQRDFAPGTTNWALTPGSYPYVAWTTACGGKLEKTIQIEGGYIYTTRFYCAQQGELLNDLIFIEERKFEPLER